MTSVPLEIEGVVKASQLDRQKHRGRESGAWTRQELAGRLCEVSGRGASASLTLVFELIRDSQREGEPAAWVSCAAEGASFYPPDASRTGVDLAALPVVRAEGVGQAGRAADRLVRSGGFGLVVLDLAVSAARGSRGGGGGRGELARPLQKRLLSHAEQQEVAVVLVTDKLAEQPSEGALVSFRGQTHRRREGRGRFRCRLEVLADNRMGPGWSRETICEGPAGLR